MKGLSSDSASLSEPSERALTRLAVITSVMDVANAEKDGKCLRFKQSWENLAYSYKDFKKSLELRRDEMLADCMETQLMRDGSASLQLEIAAGLFQMRTSTFASRRRHI